MRKTFFIAAICLLIGAAAGRTQVSTPAYVVQVQAGTTIANCPVVAGATQFCYVATGAFWSLNGGPYTPMLTPAVVGSVLTVNNKKPDATGNVALTAATSIQ